jgi:hypothetical protein
LDESLFSQLQQMLEIKAKKATLLYRGSQDGFMARDFHSRCDNLSDTLTVVKSTSGHKFGGYTNQKWNNTSAQKKRNVGIIFSLVNKVNRKIRFSFEQAQTNDKFWIDGPIFGAKDEELGLLFYLHICNASNVYRLSSCNLSQTFKYPDYITEYITEGGAFLAGSTYFTVAEIEVFHIKKKSSHKKAKVNKN